MLLLFILIQLFFAFGSLHGIELPLELLHGDVHLPKSTDYAHRLSFPLSASDVVEMPLNVEDNLDFNGGGDANDMNMDDDLRTKTEIPKWFQMQIQQEQQQHHHMDHKNYHDVMPQKNDKHKHHHSNSQLHSTVSPLRRCSIEISSKIPGICQAMGSIGNACVSGDYIDVFNAECL